MVFTHRTLFLPTIKRMSITSGDMPMPCSIEYSYKIYEGALTDGPARALLNFLLHSLYLLLGHHHHLPSLSFYILSSSLTQNNKRR